MVKKSLSSAICIIYSGTQDFFVTLFLSKIGKTSVIVGDVQHSRLVSKVTSMPLHGQPHTSSAVFTITHVTSRASLEEP
ncbi:hypothetical protein RRG08_030899 [Elysia crispata]|uniref:Uncharacterized protein n=1 Tax=Elysia crispata TaxID=231223 RepID=A0AAE1AHI4_9GAST|nr:hypothetical protein RRG08_030899 [Elysia crispata]